MYVHYIPLPIHVHVFVYQSIFRLCVCYFLQFRVSLSHSCPIQPVYLSLMCMSVHVRPSVIFMCAIFYHYMSVSRSVTPRPAHMFSIFFCIRMPVHLPIRHIHIHNALHICLCVCVFAFICPYIMFTVMCPCVCLPHSCTYQVPGTYQVRPHLIRKVGADEASYGSANSQSVKKPIDACRAFSRPDLNELSVSESITC